MTDVEPTDLTIVLAEIALPALSAVFKNGELSAVALTSSRTGSDPDWAAELTLNVQGERFTDRIFDSDIDSWSLSNWRDRLSENLEDFVAESHFGWGEDRRGSVAGS